MLKLNNVEVIYSNVILVLKGISMEVPDGNIVALLGANGAGKTTTLKAISGLLSIEDGKVTDGTMEFDGVRIDNGDPETTVKMGIAQILEGRLVFQHLTVEENLMAGSYSVKDRAKVKKDLDLMFQYFPRLKQLRSRTSGYLSGGEQQMLVIGSALMARPKLMLLDEPSLGLSPLMVEEIFTVIYRINQEEKTAMLLVEQNARAALDLADYGYVMENGRIVLDGPTDKLRENEDIKEFYLGLSGAGEKKSYKDIKHYRRRKRWLG
jgi:branched-chain amino acid transport system ATP-binding protein